MNLKTGYIKKEMLQKRSFFSLPSSPLPVKSSLLKYIDLWSLQCGPSCPSQGKTMDEKKKKKKRQKKKRHLEMDKERENIPNMRKWQLGIFRAALEHKRVIVLAQMLLSHNKQDTMFLLSWWAQSVKWLKIDFVPVITVCKLLSRDCKGSDFLITYILWCLMIGFLK